MDTTHSPAARAGFWEWIPAIAGAVVALIASRVGGIFIGLAAAAVAYLVARLLRRWRVPQALAVAGIVLLVVTVGGMRPGQVTSSTPVPSADKIEAQWSKTSWHDAAVQFAASHPVLRFGNNWDLVQTQINALKGQPMSPTQILDTAFERARKDPTWTYADGRTNATTKPPKGYTLQ